MLSGFLNGTSQRPQIWDSSVEKARIEIPDADAGLRQSGFVYSVRSEGSWKSVKIPVMLFLPDTLPAARSRIQTERFSIQYSARYSTPAIFVSNYRIILADTSHIQQFRMKIQGRLARLLNSEVHGIGFAMMLGSKDYLTKDEYARYKRGGGAHVLAVSGLHVGLIYGVLFFLLKPLGNTPGTRIFRILSMIIALWLYAAVTGFSPSVVRAVGFFSVFSVAALRNSASGVGHALVLLLLGVGVFRSDILFTPGLQLSYTAVLGILLFQPFIERHIKKATPLWKWLLRMLGVSITAQLLTLPLVIHYFGGASILGVITSLVYIPFTFFIIVMLILLVVTGDIFADAINMVLAFVKSIVDASVDSLTGWEYAYIELSMTAVQICIYYVGVGLIYVAIRWPDKYLWLFILLGFGFLMVGY